MDLRYLLGQAEGAESAGYEREVVPPRVLRLTRQAGVGPSLEMALGWLKGARRFEYQADGRGRILAPVLALALAQIPAEELGKEISVWPAV